MVPIGLNCSECLRSLLCSFSRGPALILSTVCDLYKGLISSKNCFSECGNEKIGATDMF